MNLNLISQEENMERDTHGEKTVCRCRERASEEKGLANTLILGFQKNEFLLLRPLVCGALLWQPQQAGARGDQTYSHGAARLSREPIPTPQHRPHPAPRPERLSLLPIHLS